MEKELPLEVHYGFEIISTYFCNVFYNSLYSQSEALYVKNKFKCLTEAYEKCLLTYIVDLPDLSKYDNDNPNNENNNLINKATSMWIRDINVSFIETGVIYESDMDSAITYIYNSFIPTEYTVERDRDKKLGMIYKIFRELVRTTANTIVEKYMSSIIDKRNEVNANCIKRDIYNTCEIIRADIRESIIKTTMNDNQKNNIINKKMKDQFNKYKEVMAKYDEVSEINVYLKAKIRELESSIFYNKEEIDKLKAECYKYKNELIHETEKNKSYSEELKNIKKVQSNIRENHGAQRESRVQKTPKGKIWKNESAEPSERIEQIELNTPIIRDMPKASKVQYMSPPERINDIEDNVDPYSDGIIEYKPDIQENQKDIDENIQDDFDIFGDAFAMKDKQNDFKPVKSELFSKKSKIEPSKNVNDNSNMNNEFGVDIFNLDDFES